MKENTEEIIDTKFEISVPYNHEILANQRKKSKKIAGIMSMVLGVLFLAFTIWMGLSMNYDSITTLLLFLGIFGLLGLGSIALGIYNFCTMKPNIKNDDKFVRYYFEDWGLRIKEDKNIEKKKTSTLENCLYRKYANKQYVNLVTEYEDRFEFQIFVGTTNGVPNYHTILLPKDVLTAPDELNNFTEFLKSKLENDYRVK